MILGGATRGFFMLQGLGLGVRGTAAVNLVVIGAWFAVAWRLRVEYVRTIQQSIHRHRIDAERTSSELLDRSALAALATTLASDDPVRVKEALLALESQPLSGVEHSVQALLDHPDAEIRRRALALLSATGDRTIAARATTLLRDSDLGVRTEALLYVTRELGADPLRQLEELGDVEDFSIRAGLAAFLASPGKSQNLDAARLILEGMVGASGEAGLEDRRQAARVLGVVPAGFADLLTRLIEDDDPVVARRQSCAPRGHRDRSSLPRCSMRLRVPI